MDTKKLATIEDMLNEATGETTEAKAQDFASANKLLLEEMGLNIQENIEPQESDSARSKVHSNWLFASVSAWLGQTAQRDLYQAHRNRQHSPKTMSLPKIVEEFNKVQTIKAYTKHYIENFCRPGVANRDQKVNDALIGLKELAKLYSEGEKISVWALVRAINKAIGRANYGNWMRKSGFIYKADSNHRIIVVPITGEYKWTTPDRITFDWVPATTEEDYIRPFVYQDIEDPENPGNFVKMRVYKNMGNVVHPSTSYTKQDLQEGDPLVKGLLSLAEGEMFRKEYSREISVDEFEKQAESDVNFLRDKAEEFNMKVWHSINTQDKSVTIFHAGLIVPEVAEG